MFSWGIKLDMEGRAVESDNVWQLMTHGTGEKFWGWPQVRVRTVKKGGSTKKDLQQCGFDNPKLEIECHLLDIILKFIDLTILQQIFNNPNLIWQS